MIWYLSYQVLVYKRGEKLKDGRWQPTSTTNSSTMDFMSTSMEANHTQLGHLIDLTELLIALRQRLEQDTQRRHACIKLYEGTCDPHVNFGMLTINHAEETNVQFTILTIPTDSDTMRNIVKHVFRDWDHLESFLGEQNGWIFHP